MKKAITQISILLGTTLFSGSLFAADSLEHFVTNDGRHFCSIFMKSEFKPCEEFGIVYEGDRVVSGKEPGFSAGFPTIEKVTIGAEEFCIEGSIDAPGHEVAMEKCSSSTQNATVTEYEENGVKVRIKTYPAPPADSSDVVSSTSSGTTNADDSFTNGDVTMLGMVEDSSGAAGPTEVISGSVSGNDSEMMDKQIAIPVSTVPEKPQFTTSGELKGSCTVNGKEVDCTEIANGVKSVVKTGMSIISIILILSLIFSIFWIWMLVHAFGNPIPNKTLWILAIFFFSPLGAIIYYFVVKRSFQHQNPPGQYPQAGISSQNLYTPPSPQNIVETNVSSIVTPVVTPTIPANNYLSESNLGVQSSLGNAEVGVSEMGGIPQVSSTNVSQSAPVIPDGVSTPIDQPPQPVESTISEASLSGPTVSEGLSTENPASISSDSSENQG